MLPAALETAAHKLSIWLADRLAAPRRFPMPLSDLYGRIDALVHSRQALAMVCAVGLVMVVHGIRSAWWDVYGRWYRRCRLFEQSADGSGDTIRDFPAHSVLDGARSRRPAR